METEGENREKAVTTCEGAVVLDPKMQRRVTIGLVVLVAGAMVLTLIAPIFFR